MYVSPFRYGDLVMTPEGPGAVVHVDAEMDWRDGGAKFGPGPVEVQLDGKAYPYDQYRARPSYGDPFDPSTLTKRLDRGDDSRETLEAFVARKTDPSWKAPALPKSRKLGKLSDKRRAALEAEWAEAVAAYARYAA